jgi:hypothetical protein
MASWAEAKSVWRGKDNNMGLRQPAECDDAPWTGIERESSLKSPSEEYLLSPDDLGEICVGPLGPGYGPYLLKVAGLLGRGLDRERLVDLQSIAIGERDRLVAFQFAHVASGHCF